MKTMNEKNVTVTAEQKTAELRKKHFMMATAKAAAVKGVNVAEVRAYMGKYGEAPEELKSALRIAYTILRNYSKAAAVETASV